MSRLSLLVLAASLAACRQPEQAAPPAAEPAQTPLSVAAPVRLKTAAISFPDGSKLDVELADTPELRERGLMFRQTISPEEGMLFVFERDDALAFWMKNTFIDLDMVWMDASGAVTVIHQNVPRSKPGMTDTEVATRAGHGLYVLELAAGQAAKRKITVGSVLGIVRPPAAP